MKTIKLPKFSKDIIVYDEGDTVQNPYSGETYTLTAEENIILLKGE